MQQHPLNVRWVPGTSNRLLVTTADRSQEIPLQRFEAICGRQATFDLYLVGKTTLQVPEQQLKQLGV